MKNINQNTFIGRLESQGAGGINRRLVQRCVSVSARGSQGHPASGQSWENTIIIIIIIIIVVVVVVVIIIVVVVIVVFVVIIIAVFVVIILVLIYI